MLGRKSSWVAAAITAALLNTTVCRAELANPAPVVAFDRIVFGTLVLAPIGGIRFCLEHRPDCAASSARPNNERVALTNERWQELWRIDNEVNQEISPDAKLGPGTEQWKIAPLYGNCHDYAVTKRHDLLALGWPPSDLLLAEVLLPTDEHHLVLVVRTSEGDLVLDNLNSDLVPVATTYGRFKWLRIQTPQNPYYWARVGTSGTERPGPRHLSPAVAFEPAITPNEAPQAYALQWASGVQPGSPALRQSIAEQKQTARAQRPVPPFGRAEANSASHRQAVAAVANSKNEAQACPGSHACRKPLALLSYAAVTRLPSASAARSPRTSRTWLGGSSNTAIW